MAMALLLSISRGLGLGAPLVVQRGGRVSVREAQRVKLRSSWDSQRPLRSQAGAGDGFGAPPLPRKQRKGQAAAAGASAKGGESADEPPTVRQVDRSNLLVVGLGNPGKMYEMTRHNLGFLVSDELRRRWNVDMRPNKRFLGEYGSTRVGEKSVGLLKPSTFMNLSGQSVRAVLDYFKISRSNVLVLVDEVAIDYGTLRLRLKGSPGGHNASVSIFKEKCPSVAHILHS
jgi:hypothetical protein